MRLADLIGQSGATTVLRNAIRRDRVAQAYLFWGPEGVGKSTAAVLFAQALNCLSDERGATGDACGECRSCQLIAKGSHPDVRVITPAGEGEGSVIPIEVIRNEFVHDIHLRPVTGRHKVYLLDPADRTAPLAIHTILKALEEPPARVVTILVTSRPALLPPTVPSRCQQVAFRLAGTEAVERKLRELDVKPETAAALARISGGRVGWAIRAAARPQIAATRQALLDLCAALDRQPISSALRLAEEIKLLAAELARADEREGAESGDEEEEDADEEAAAASRGTRAVPNRAVRAQLPWCLEVMASWYRDCLAAAEGTPLVNPDQAGVIGEAARSLSCQRAGAAVEAVLAARRQIERNANMDLALECLALGLLGGDG